MNDRQNQFFPMNIPETGAVRSVRSLRGHLAIAAGLLSVVCATSFAAPAPWYYWRSVVTADRVCAQVSPGDGWTQDGGPYKDPRCASRY